MAKSPLLLTACLWSSVLVLGLILRGASGSFSDLFEPYWAPQNIAVDEGGDTATLSLDSFSGCGFGSKKKYLFGLTSMQIKLVQGDSAGTVTAFYLSSEGPNHDELDFEFLGNVSGEPYLVQTNVYVNGTGNREQRHTLWFDPTQDFHTYSFFSNRKYLLFLIDGIPIRAFTNKEMSGIAYPRTQPMGVRASVWNADDWATQGGRVKTNWSHAPFVSTFKSFQIDACELPTDDNSGFGTVDVDSKCGDSGQFWWDKPDFGGLNKHRSRQLRWARKKHLVYDYCLDNARFSDQLPKECIA